MTDDSSADGGGEDKMAVAGRRLLEAKKEGKLPPGVEVDPDDPAAIARFYEARFREDAKRLGLRVVIEAERDATLMPRATEHVGGMVRLVERLVASGHAYVRGEPGTRAVYFDVGAFPRYGELSGNTPDTIRGGAGGRVAEDAIAQKKHPADFLLWKEDASHLMRWASPWGEGYPGWHIECSAMSLGRLVDGGLDAVLSGRNKPGSIEIDIHTGGEDNIFPHHECEIAQSCAASGSSTFARHWMHARFLLVNGEKMSKSKGTFFTARELFQQGFDPAALRLELIKTQYRQNADFTLDGLRASGRMVDRWRRFAEAGGAAGQAGERNREVADAFGSCLNDDLNVAGAIGAINSWMGSVSDPSRADAALFAEFDAVLGLLELERASGKEAAGGIALFLPGVEPSEAVERLLVERAGARKAKDFARADAIRDELAAQGLRIKDAAGGKVEVGRA